MSEVKVYAVKPEIAATAHINQAEYQALYRRSIEEPEQFWAEQGRRLG
jgi:acetyl-CoA synthetase